MSLSPVWVRMKKPEGASASGRVCDPLMVTFPEICLSSNAALEPNRTWAPSIKISIVDYGSALGYLFSAITWPVSPAHQDPLKGYSNYTKGTVIPVSQMYSKCLAILARDDNYQAPAMASVFWPQNPVPSTPRPESSSTNWRRLPLIFGSTLIDGGKTRKSIVKLTDEEIRNGVGGKQIGADFRKELLQKICPLPLRAPVHETSCVKAFKRRVAEVLKVPECQRLKQNIDNLEQVNKIRQRYTRPILVKDDGFHIGFGDPENDVAIYRWFRLTLQYREGFDSSEIPSDQTFDQYLRDCPTWMNARKAAIDAYMVFSEVAVGPGMKSDLTRRETNPENPADVYEWHIKKVVVPLDSESRVCREVASLSFWDGKEGLKSHIDKVYGQDFGHCSETYPFIYFAKQFGELIKNRTIPISEQNSIGKILSCISLRPRELWKQGRAFSDGDSGKRRDPAKLKVLPRTHDIEQKRFPVPQYPCDNCKCLVRLHRHEMKQFNEFLNSENEKYEVAHPLQEQPALSKTIYRPGLELNPALWETAPYARECVGGADP